MTVAATIATPALLSAGVAPSLHRCDLCLVYWHPDAAADALTCRNTLTVCVDADACVARATLLSDLDSLIAAASGRFHVKTHTAGGSATPRRPRLHVS